MASSGTDSGGPWRVEWRGAGGTEVLARLDSGYRHHTALEPWVSRLRADGRREGELALVDEASGAVVARRRLDRPVRRRTPTPPRRERPRTSRAAGPAALDAPGAPAAEALGVAG
jgi:hypothetical protein